MVAQVPEKVDLCVLDYILPDADGLELLQNLKQNHAHIPVIMITAYPSWELSNRALSLDYGADYFLSKPFDPDEFKQKVVNCLKKGGVKMAYQVLKKFRENHPGNSKVKIRKDEREKRLVEMIRLITKEPKKWTSDRFASRFNVVQKTIQDDIKTLKERGYRICSESYRYYLKEE